MEMPRHYADDFGTDMVTLLVGPDRQKFVVHKNLLVSQSKYFKSALAAGLFREAIEGVVTFDEDDPDAFRLLINWLYRGHIPRVQPFITKPDFSIQGMAQPDAAATGAIPPSSIKEDTNILKRGRDYDGSEIIVRHLSSHSTYKQFSPEEIRLADYEVSAVSCARKSRRGDVAITPRVRRELLGALIAGEAAPAVNTPSTGAADRETVNNNFQHAPGGPGFTFQMRKPPQTDSDSEGSKLDETDEEQKQAPNWNGWSFPIGFEPAAVTTRCWFNWKAGPGDLVFASYEQASHEADRHQLHLAQLIALAEKLCWDELFNAAMDAYLDGERLMIREFVPLAHLQVAYTKCCATSAFRRLLFDRVYFEVTTYKTHLRYLELSQTCEDFLADLFTRLDQQAWVPGELPYTNMTSPLSVRSCIYHRHDEWMGKTCF
ncbi:Kelch repeat and BTB domain-containing protein 7 [Madurella mycetomatis]|uniref:Kelch repeat and BTB domain-containing protein 7 n=1 Tax=Madurella mycetomatis TaxID=100816 RepID=A0A175VSW2_9PEZI|nr:Kelch repeat and BTB domain-containing protein 7 [Madurella mycetomatis]